MKHKLATLVSLIANLMTAEIEYRLPPITYPTREEMYERYLNDGKALMDVKGIPDAIETLVCTNWVCPTSVVVNVEQYSIVKDEWAGVISTDIMTTNLPPMKKAHARIYLSSSAKAARRMVFASFNQSDVLMATDIAPRISVRNLDQATNMMFVASSRDGGTNDQWVIYKNMTVSANAPTNALDFAVAIINAGLPENERIAVTPEGE